jgi:hypothetical protein
MPGLIAGHSQVTFTAMKLFLSILAYSFMGAAIALGIYLAVLGTYWVLAASVLAYVIAFARFGCAEH